MRLRRLLSTLRLRLRSVFRRARVEQDLDDEIRDHIERRIADGRRSRRATRAGAAGGPARLRRHRAGEGGVPRRATREPDRAHGAGPALRGPPLRARAGCHGDDGRDLRAGHRLQHRAVPVRPVVRQWSCARHRAAGVAGPDPRHRARPAGPRDRPGVLVSRIPGVRRAAVALQRRRRVDVVRHRLRRRHARGRTSQSGAATYVTGNYFHVLGLRPTLGVALPMDANDADPAPPLVAVISHLLWERHYERSPDVIGRSMKVNGVAVTIVGVAPRRFAGARTGGSQMRVWLPLSTRPQVQRTDLDARQLRRRPVRPCGAPAAGRARRADAADGRGDRRTGDAADDVGHCRCPPTSSRCSPATTSRRQAPMRGPRLARASACCFRCWSC